MTWILVLILGVVVLVLILLGLSLGKTAQRGDALINEALSDPERQRGEAHGAEESNNSGHRVDAKDPSPPGSR